MEIHANLVGVSGTGSVSNRLYHAVGAAAGTVLVPNGPPDMPLGLTGSFVLLPNGPPNRPKGPPTMPVLIELSLTFNKSFVLTGGTATVVGDPAG